MATQIFVNVSVRDVTRTIDFFKKLGFSFNMQFTNDKAACMIINENAFFMLLQEEFFRTFTNKSITDTKKSVEGIFAISADSRARVDEMIRIANENGGSIVGEPKDHGWMYTHSFEDLDGHIWEVLFIDAAAIPENL
ncbi:MAG TPA: VOC family protein [Chitinophagaceae bacterium]|nr:VOC family protein [Chitinophagaceae bacterium]